LSAWLSPGARDVVWRVAHHAVSANSDDSTLEARIMLSQSSLDYLDWVTYVLEQGRPRQVHRRRPAHEVMRELPSDAGVPAAIPAELTP